MRTSGSTVGPPAGGAIVTSPSGLDPGAQPGRQHLLELYERAHRGLLDSRDRGAGGAAQADRDRDGLLVVEQQGRHLGPGAASRYPPAGPASDPSDTRARAAVRRRGGRSGRGPRGGPPARRPASRGAPGAARAAPRGGSKSRSRHFTASRILRTDPDLNPATVRHRTIRKRKERRRPSATETSRRSPAGWIKLPDPKPRTSSTAACSAGSSRSGCRRAPACEYLEPGSAASASPASAPVSADDGGTAAWNTYVWVRARTRPPGRSRSRRQGPREPIDVMEAGRMAMSPIRGAAFGLWEPASTGRRARQRARRA